MDSQNPVTAPAVFSEVMAGIVQFLEPVCNGPVGDAEWNPALGQWISSPQNLSSSPGGPWRSMSYRGVRPQQA